MVHNQNLVCLLIFGWRDNLMKHEITNSDCYIQVFQQLEDKCTFYMQIKLINQSL